MAMKSLSDWYVPIQFATLQPQRQDSIGDTLMEVAKADRQAKTQKEELDLRKQELQAQKELRDMQAKEIKSRIDAEEKKRVQEEEFADLTDPFGGAQAVEEGNANQPQSTVGGRTMDALNFQGRTDDATKYQNALINQFVALGGANTPEGRAFYKDQISGREMEKPPVKWALQEVNGNLVAVNPEDPSNVKTVMKGERKPIQLSMGAKLVDENGKVIADNPYRAGGGGGGGGTPAGSIAPKDLISMSDKTGRQAIAYSKMAQGATQAAAMIRSGKVDQIGATISESMGVDPSTIPTLSQEARDALAEQIVAQAPVFQAQAQALREEAELYNQELRRRLPGTKTMPTAPGGQASISNFYGTFGQQSGIPGGPTNPQMGTGGIVPQDGGYKVPPIGDILNLGKGNKAPAQSQPTATPQSQPTPQPQVQPQPQPQPAPRPNSQASMNAAASAFQQAYGIQPNAEDLQQLERFVDPSTGMIPPAIIKQWVQGLAAEAGKRKVMGRINSAGSALSNAPESAARLSGRFADWVAGKVAP